MPRILLINDNSEQLNWGAQATPRALRAMLHDEIPGAEIEALPYSWLIQKHRRVPTLVGGFYTTRGRGVVGRLSRSVEFFPTIADDFEWFADRWEAGDGGPMADEFIEAARRADVVIHNGEHSIYRNTMEGTRALFLLWFARTRLGKPSCELNHTAHLTDVLPIMPGIVKRVYPVLDVVTVREPCSLRNLQQLGIDNVELVPDVVFYLDPSAAGGEHIAAWKRRAGLDHQPYFCLSASALPMAAPRPGRVGPVAALVRELQRIVPSAVLIAKDPHCQFLRDVAEATGAAFFGPEHALDDLWPLLHEARFLVSGHYHYVIMGSMVGCPYIPLSTNSHKMRGVCEHLGWHLETPFDATSLGAHVGAIAHEAGMLERDRSVYSDNLRERSARLRVEAGRNARLVRNVLDGVCAR